MQKSISPELSHKLANMGFVCACLVVMIHVNVSATISGLSWCCYQFMRHGICRIAVPFFFVAAGYLLAGHMGEHGWWPKAIHKRIRTLVIPYVIWSLVFSAYLVARILLVNFRTDAPFTQGLPVDWVGWLQPLGLDPFAWPWLVPLWFVRALFILVVLSPLIVSFGVLRSRWGGLLLAVALWLLALLCVVPSEAGTGRSIWSITMSVEGCAFFTLGLSLRYWGRPTWCPAWMGYLSGALGLLLIAGSAWGSAYHADWSLYAEMIGYTAALWGVWELMPCRPWPLLMTSSAFPLFLMHPFPISVWGIIVGSVASLQCVMSTFSGYLVVCVCVVMLTVAVTYLVRRCMPRVASIVFGGR